MFAGIVFKSAYYRALQFTKMELRWGRLQRTVDDATSGLQVTGEHRVQVE